MKIIQVSNNDGKVEMTMFRKSYLSVRFIRQK